MRACVQTSSAGNHIPAGLPNIWGTAKGVYLTYAQSSSYTGAFSQESYGFDGRGVSQNGSENGYRILSFNANSSNQLYGNANSVIPEYIKIPVIIYLGK